MSKKTLIITASATVVAAAALGYFVALPQIQANAYTAVVNKQQPALRDEMQQLVKLLDRDVFTKEDPDLTTIRSDIKIGNGTVADARNQLEISDSKLVDFKEYPFLAWSPGYKSSNELKAAERTYIDNAQPAVSEMEKVLVYSDKMANVKAKTDVIEAEAADIENLETPEQIISALEAIMTKTEKAAAEQKAIAPPESFKEAHTYNVTATDQMLVLYKQLIAALKNGQYDQLDPINANIQKKGNDLIKKQDEFNKKFINESVLRKHIDKMLNADRTIKKLLG